MGILQQFENKNKKFQVLRTKKQPKTPEHICCPLLERSWNKKDLGTPVAKTITKKVIESNLIHGMAVGTEVRQKYGSAGSIWNLRRPAATNNSRSSKVVEVPVVPLMRERYLKKTIKRGTTLENKQQLVSS